MKWKSSKSIEFKHKRNRNEKEKESFHFPRDHFITIIIVMVSTVQLNDAVSNCTLRRKSKERRTRQTNNKKEKRN